MGKIRCQQCGYLLGELDSKAKGKATIECHICKSVCNYSNPSKKQKSVEIAIKIRKGKDDIDWLPF